MSWWPDDSGEPLPSMVPQAEQEKKKKKKKHRSKGDTAVVEDRYDSTQAEPDMDASLHALLSAEAEAPFAKSTIQAPLEASAPPAAPATFISPFDVQATEKKRHKRRKHGRTRSSGSS